MQNLQELRPIELADWDASISAVADDMRGTPLNVHKLIANHPPLLAAWWPFRQYIVGGGSLGKRLAELLILRTAVHGHCWYEWASHVERGIAAGLTGEEIDRVVDGPGAAGWNDAEAALLEAVDQLNGGRALPAAALDRLGRHFCTAQVLDLIAIRATYVMLADMLNSWAIELDAHVADKLPETTTRERFESRVGL